MADAICTCGGNGICLTCVLLNLSTVTYRDKQDRQIVCVPEENKRMGKAFLIKVVDKGEVVDHFALYGQAALDQTAKRLGWKESK